VVERFTQQQQREQAMLERRAHAVDALRAKNGALVREQQRRFAASQELERRRVEERRSQMAAQEAQAQLRLEKLARDRDQFSIRQHARSAAQAERYAHASEERKLERDRRNQAIDQRDAAYRERRQELLREENERLKQNSLARQQRERKVEETREAKEQEQAQKNEQAKQTWKSQDEHTQQTQAEREQTAQDHARLSRLRRDLQIESALRVQKMRQIQFEDPTKDNQDRQAKAVQFVQHKQELAIKKRDERTKLDFRNREINSEFRESLRRGGKINVGELARRFSLDIDALRRRVGGRLTHFCKRMNA
jgi:colicin import membrane protein